MECPNCTFNNIPGMRGCVRCQSRLDFAGVEIVPPRAKDTFIPASIRESFYLYRVRWANASRKVHATSRATFLSGMNTRALVRSVTVPGWGHRYIGYPVFGWSATLIWIVLLAFALYLRGGNGGWPAYFFVAGWHVFVITLILSRQLRSARFPQRIGVGIGINILVNALLYIPAGTVLNRVIPPFFAYNVRPSPAIRTGDVLLTQGPWTRPARYQRGDLVQYRVPQFTIGYNYGLAGFVADRIVAVPGDTFEIKMQRDMYVNGDLIPENKRSLNWVPLPNMSITLGPDEYFIVPSAFHTFNGNLSFSNVVVNSYGKVKYDDIVGKVLWRIRPFHRFGPVNIEQSDATASPDAQSATTTAPETVPVNGVPTP